MIVHFYYKKWNPPKNPDQHTVNFIKSMCQTEGLLFLTLRFIHIPTKRAFELGMTWKKVLDFWLAGVYLYGIALACIPFAAIGKTSVIDMEAVFGTLCVVMLFCGTLFVLSVAVMGVRFAAWARKINKS